MRMLVTQHDPVSPFGPIGERFADHGYDVIPHLGGRAELHPLRLSRLRCDRPDGRSVVGLRSRPDRSMLLAEIEQLRRADAAGVSVLGICFGGQLLAAAHGSAWSKSLASAATSSTA
jgi:hypothetical protein